MNQQSDLTERQIEVLRLFVKLSETAGPTIRELMQPLGIKSPNGMRCHLESLEKKGYLKQKRPMQSRGFQATPKGLAFVSGTAEHLLEQAPPVLMPDGAKCCWTTVIENLNNASTFMQHEPALALVLLDMRDRREMGLKKYGVPVFAGNGRCGLTDAYQEILDGIVYLQKSAEEESSPEFLASLHRLVGDMIKHAVEVRSLMKAKGIGDAK